MLFRRVQAVSLRSDKEQAELCVRDGHLFKGLKNF
jgi:hypothetical protein